MLNADPVNPVWWPMCLWGPGYGRFGGRCGPFRRLETDKKTVLAVTRRHWRGFGNVLAHRDRVCVPQLSYSHESRDLLVCGGVWAGGEIPGPNLQKKIGREKNPKNTLNTLLLVAKYVFVKNRAIFFRFRPLVHPWAVRTEKT